MVRAYVNNINRIYYINNQYIITSIILFILSFITEIPKEHEVGIELRKLMIEHYSGGDSIRKISKS